MPKCFAKQWTTFVGWEYEKTLNYFIKFPALGVTISLPTSLRYFARLILTGVIPQHGTLFFALLHNQPLSRHMRKEVVKKWAVVCNLENVFLKTMLLGHVQNDSFVAPAAQLSFLMALEIWSLSVTFSESLLQFQLYRQFPPSIFKHTCFLFFYIVRLSAERRRLKSI